MQTGMYHNKETIIQKEARNRSINTYRYYDAYVHTQQKYHKNKSRNHNIDANDILF